VLQPCDVGHRVVVRRRLGAGDMPEGAPGPRFTDILGVLTAFEADHLTVRSEDGVEHTVNLTDVEAGKRIGPRPARYSEIIALERLADRAWPAPVHERLGEWFLRAADGWTNRANSALPLGDPGLPMDEAAEQVRHWYTARGLQPKITVPLPLRRDVANVLRNEDWEAQPLVLVQTADLADSAVLHEGVRFSGVALSEEPSDDFLDIVRARKESLPGSAIEVIKDVPAVRFAEARDADGTLLAITRGACVDGWLHVALVEVVPAARRRGLARQLFMALGGWARTEHDAARAVLQVEEHNEAAVALYSGLGFTTHHTYVTFHPRRG
jgi:N-acetylglutamate synthase